ncbi:hypothetical protein FQN50_004617 [Emmonsiellopsis sp. PD_5]|nr:hypothetical protein FQN50_004617 [Emmonsiellopsis sp. PD_5]
MSRSAADATRFTATGPYASSKPSMANSALKGAASGSSNLSSQSPNSSSPKETPKQKVERLRAQARAARYAKNNTPADRFMAKGRIWADRLHKVTVYTLIGASGIAFVLTAYSATSLILYNRRQRALWLDRELEKLLDAKKAYVAGNATEEQMKILEQEKIGEQEKRRKEELKRQTTFYKGKEWLFGGLKNEDLANTQSRTLDETANPTPSVLEAVNAKRAETAAAFEQQTTMSGELDQPVQNVDEGLKETKRSWTSWITGR